jgi:co-chaperonin GroES (HSP10)
MSNLILPPGIHEIPTITTTDRPPTDTDDGAKARAVPDPTGWKILCVVPTVEHKFEGSDLIKPESLARVEEQTTTVLFVLKVGPDAYKDATKFPTGAWCKEGDFVLVRAYAGTRFKMYGKEMRLLNDDQVDAVVEDPRGITRP